MERLEKRGQGLDNFKKYNFVFYIIILFITILATFPFYRGNFHAGNDFAFNYARVMSTISALKDGQVIPQFDPNALRVLDMPGMNFMVHFQLILFLSLNLLLNHGHYPLPFFIVYAFLYQVF
ncbi:hypothetical protein ICE98_00700 [Lactococcus lactis]|nr:hypothetical protein [Lactococcus lactis]